MPSKVFVAATRQNDGKTMVSMGLFNALTDRFDRVGYMKPVGQQYKLVDGEKVDKDVLLFKDTYNLQDSLTAMSPIAVPSGFTQAYIENGSRDALVEAVDTAYAELAEEKQFVLIEGTGHAGVGSVFDLSNAHVAKQLNTKVILVSLGGIGRAIDEIMLNKTCFDQQGVEIAGVIINKVAKDKYDKVTPVVKKGLTRHGLDLLGAIPFSTLLTKPTVQELQEVLNADILSGEAYMDNTIQKTVIGDMLPHEALSHFVNDTLLIVPANREGLVMTALCGNMVESDVSYFISCIILTGGSRPHDRILNIIKHIPVPVLLVENDSFTVSKKINSMFCKLRAGETEKIEKIKTLVEKYVDVDKIIDRVTS